jgi:hypothetical protein
MAPKQPRPSSTRAKAKRPPPRPFELSEAILREAHAEPYDRASDQQGRGPWDPLPVTRPLLVYTQDPATPRMDVAVARADVPYEPLGPGPEGSVAHVIDRNETLGQLYPPIDLDALGVLAPHGVKPSTGNPQFAQQMAYAVTMLTYERFRRALGRTPDFSFGPERPEEPSDGTRVKLHVYPHARKEDNAYYDPDRGALLFGYTFAGNSSVGLNQPGGVIFTVLSHDVVVHECTHALLDGQRARFILPMNPDVGAFHEAFADLVALFQRFQYRELVQRGVSQSPDLQSRLLTDIARQWGEATGEGPRAALRSALVAAGGASDPVPDEHRYDPGKEVHDLGAVLVAAVFDAFRWIFARKTAVLHRLAAGHAHPPAELIELLASHAERLASQFLDIVIRAVDYCPPVDVTFGEYLRAMITADYELVPEDPWGYREALVQAFRRYGITVDRVADLSEESLLWRPPEGELPPIEALAFARLRHTREPGEIDDTAERRRRAEALAEFVTRPEHLYRFGLSKPISTSAHRVDPPVIESIRTLRRIGPDNTVHYDLVAEVTQRRKTRQGHWFYGGSTIIVDPHGVVSYSIAKLVDSARREAAFERYLAAAPETCAALFRQDVPRTARFLRELHTQRRKVRDR